MERVKTGIEGLDKLIEGGVPKSSITLVSGPPGSGKSIFCFHFLHQGVQQGEKCLFLTLDKNVDSVLGQARELGFDFQPGIEKGLMKFLFLNINKKFVYETMTNEILSGEYNRVVLDSITPLSEMPLYLKDVNDKRDFSIITPDEFPSDSSLPVRRLHLRYVLSVLETTKCTSVVTSELPIGYTSMSRDGISEFLADAVILLSLDPTMDRRKMSVMKMRGTRHTLKPQDIEIAKGGIKLI